MKICVIGGGNIGTVLAAELAAKGQTVIMMTTHPQGWSRELMVYDAAEKLLYRGVLAEVTDDLKHAVQNAELVFVTYPAFLFRNLSKQLEPILRVNQKLVIVPGSGGVEREFAGLIAKGVEIWGLQRVHDIARLKEKGRSVYSLGRKSSLKVAAIPAQASQQAAKTLEDLLEIPCQALPNYWCVTLNPSNPILHPSRIYTMFKDYTDGTVYDHEILFYEEWDDVASEVLFRCDAELQALCRAIPEDLSGVESLPSYYESPTPASMTRKIRSIPAFKGIKAPMRKVEGGWVPDFESRYFTADFPYGLNVIRRVATEYEVRTPMMDEIWGWYTRQVNKEGDFAIKKWSREPGLNR